MGFRIRRMGRPASRLTLLATILLAAWFSIGCSNDDALIVAPPDDALIATPPTDLIAAPPTHASYAPSLGPAGLNQNVFDATVIARVRLKSTSASAERLPTRGDGTVRHQGLVQFTFKVFEYLKGSGGAELVAVAHVDHRSEVIQSIMDRNAKGEFIHWHTVERTNPYTSMELALEAAKKWKVDRDTRWDDREAIVMVREVPVPGSTDGSQRYKIGAIYDYGVDTYHRVWLPSAASGGAEGERGSEKRFLLEPPQVSGATGAASEPETISVSEMKTLIAKMEKWRKDGEGVTGYFECIRESFIEESILNGYKARGESMKERFVFPLASGLPRHSVVKETHPLGARIWLDGKDKDLFEISIHSNGVILATRPLPAGEYTVYHNIQFRKYIPCGYLPHAARNNRPRLIQVTAPTGAVHEAFFDPVNLTSGVGADSSNGVLKPSSFTVNKAATALKSLKWESPSGGSGQAGVVKLKLSPHTGLANHVLDFIALDGTVSVSLDVSDATVDAANNTLSWAAATQPWKNGDLLMLRIRAVTATPTPTPVPRFSCTIIDLGEVSGAASIPNALGSGDCYDGGYTDYYAFTLKDAAQVRIDFESSDFDTYLKLRAGKSKTGDILAEHDDVNYHGGDTDSRINRQLNAGTYTIEATTFDLDTSGSYTLTLSVK